MTHDELLTYIFWSSGRSDEVGQGGWNGLRAVVELHSPNQSGLCEWCTCRDCSHMVSYPCKTIQKIEQVLS